MSWALCSSPTRLVQQHRRPRGAESRRAPAQRVVCQALGAPDYRGLPLALRNELLTAVETLGPNAVLPGASEEKQRVDSLVRQISRDTNDAVPIRDEALYGVWQLVYASQGTVVTRTGLGTALMNAGSSLPGLGIRAIKQHLRKDDSGRVLVLNEAEFGLGLLGSWQVAIEGYWRTESPGDIRRVKVVFERFKVKPVGYLGSQLPEWLPQMLISLGGSEEGNRTGALWLTPYLDTDLRVGEGSKGNLFLFKRVT